MMAQQEQLLPVAPAESSSASATTSTVSLRRTNNKGAKATQHQCHLDTSCTSVSGGNNNNSKRNHTTTNKNTHNSNNSFFGRSSSIRSPLMSYSSWPRRQRQHEIDNYEEPFHVIVINVGSTLLLICAVVYLFLMVSTSRSFSFPVDLETKRDTSLPQQPQQSSSLSSISSHHRFDPYAIADEFLQKHQLPQPKESNDFGSLLHLFLPQAAMLRNEFARKFGGGKQNARTMLHRGIHAIVNNKNSTYNKNDKEKNIRKRRKQDRTMPSSESASSMSSSIKKTGQTLENNTSADVEVDDDYGAIVITLAQRLQHAAQTKGTFRILVVGSSAAAAAAAVTGQQGSPAISSTSVSYARMMEQFITTACAAMGISLVVQNAAVADNDPFPWTWCLGHFAHDRDGDQQHYSTIIDLIIWDFDNDKSSSSLQSFEAFLRHAATINTKQKKVPPLFMFRVASSSSFSANHISLLQSYIQAGVLTDAVVIDLDRAVQPVLAMDDSQRPIGFTSWSASGDKGKSSALSKTKSTTTTTSNNNKLVLSATQHELIAWLVTMHILSALEWIAADSSVSMDDHGGKLLPEMADRRSAEHLPAPFLPPSSTWSAPWMPLAMGTPIQEQSNGNVSTTTTTSNNNHSWKLTRPQCRTSFDSILPSNLQDVIVSNTVGNKDVTSLLQPKSAMFYNTGWVLDLDVALKRSKRLHQQQADGDDDRDIKKAYYGVSTSGPLRMFLPIMNNNNKLDEQNDGESTDNRKNNPKNKSNRAARLPKAMDVIESLAVCAFTLTHRPDGCYFPKDLEFRVGGKVAKAEKLVPSEIVSSDNNPCVLLEVPNRAKLTRRDSVKNNKEKESTIDDDTQKANHDMDSTSSSDVKGNEMVGLLLEIKVNNSRLTWDKGPCSVAQVIWQTK